MGKRADGRVVRTVSIPGTGFVHRETIGGGRPATASRGQPGQVSPVVGCSFVVLSFVGVGVLFYGMALIDRVRPGPVAVILALAVALAGGLWFIRAVDAARKKRAANARAAAAHAIETRVAELAATYGDDNAQRMLACEPWQGATGPMIRAMLGAPEHVMTKTLKTKTRETWCYDRLDARRFALKVVLENDVCVGWEKK